MLLYKHMHTDLVKDQLKLDILSLHLVCKCQGILTLSAEDLRGKR